MAETRRNVLCVGGAATVLAVVSPAIATPNPDAELIRLCDRLVVNRTLEAAAYDANPNRDDERAEVTDPLNAEWFELRDRLFELDSPTTARGARAMALAALSEHPRDMRGNLEYDELYAMLAMGCADYILAAVPA